MDVTDTWFEGRGCDLAARDRTKEGFGNRQKVGIVLLCSAKGYPLRWKVVAGKKRDAPIMSDMLPMIHLAPWVGDAPLVCDRAMGQAGSVAKLLDSGIRFLTAVPRSEIVSYAIELPVKGLHKLTLGLTLESYEDDVTAVAAAVDQGGMTRVDNRLFVLDLGVRERELVFQHHDGVGEPEYSPDDLTGGALAILKARRLREMIDCGEAKSDRTGVMLYLQRSRGSQDFRPIALVVVKMGYTGEGIFFPLMAFREPHGGDAVAPANRDHGEIIDVRAVRGHGRWLCSTSCAPWSSRPSRSPEPAASWPSKSSRCGTNSASSSARSSGPG